MATQRARAGHAGSASTLSTARHMAVKLSANPDHNEWLNVAKAIQVGEGLPVLSDSGLRKIFKEFDAISRKMDRLYDRYASDPRTAILRGGVIMIWAYMCEDAVLRDKFVEAGLLDKIIPLMDDPRLGALALYCLDFVVMHEGDTHKLRIMKYIPKIAQIVKQHHTERHCLFGVSIISRCLSVFAREPPSAQKAVQTAAKAELFRSLDFAEFLELLMDVVTRTMWTWPDMLSGKAPETVIANVAHILSLAPLYVRPLSIFHKDKRVVDFLVCGLESQQWRIGALCFIALINLQHGVSEPVKAGDDIDTQSGEEDPVELMFAKVMYLKFKAPDSLSSLMGPLDVDRLEMAISSFDTQEYLSLIKDAIEAEDLYDIGLILARSIEKAQVILLPSRLQPLEPTKSCPFLAQFASTSDVLKACIQAIRDARDKKTLYLADILNVYRHYTFGGSEADGAKMVRKALKSYPECAYFYYILVARCSTLSDDEALQLNEIALHPIEPVTCVPPALTVRLLEQGVALHGRIGIHNVAQDFEWHSKGPHLIHGAELLLKTAEYAGNYFKIAGGGSRGTGDIVAWLLLSLVITTATRKGPKYDLKGEEAQKILKKLYIADTVAEFIGIPKSLQKSKSKIRRALDLFLSRHDEAVKAFDPIFQKMEEYLVTARSDHHENGCPWACLGELKEEDYAYNKTTKGIKTKLADTLIKTTDRKAPWNDPERGPTFDVCLNCGNTSRAFQRCSGCRKVKFCGKECQKEAWKSHRVDCAKWQAERRAASDEGRGL